MYAYTVNAFLKINAPDILHLRIKDAPSLALKAFGQAKKNPPKRVLAGLTMNLAGVHAPPEHMPEDRDLLFLHLLEAVVLVGMLVTIEAAQADAGRQAIQLLHS